MTYRLGIDAGGTYTDAVLIDGKNQIMAIAKSLTTAFELSIGISNVLNELPAKLLKEVSLVSLATTLTTNSIIEGRGGSVCGLFPGYHQKQLQRAGMYKILHQSAVYTLAGGHNALGNELEKLDERKVRQIIKQHANQVSAFAISSIFSIRNHAHEERIRQLVEEICDMPVTCGHELADNLGAPRRALTAVLNARMIPYIQHLIYSVLEILQRLTIHAPLMICKGDGSLVNYIWALKHPVTTVLSGPAASIIGAVSLSGVKDAIVVDMGGTTTDIAIVNNGLPALGTDGARVGNWKPMVDAIRVYSIGLGGDSDLKFRSELQIGPRRVIPLSLLVHEYPELLTRLQHQLERDVNPRQCRFVLPMAVNEHLPQSLSDEELHAWELVQKQPLEIDTLFTYDRQSARSLARLQRLGLVIYSGFTPSDAAHVLGFNDHWSQEGARLGALLWARQMRCLYGFGKWKSGDARTPCRYVFDHMIGLISQKLVEAGLEQSLLSETTNTRDLAGKMAALILKNDVKDACKPLLNLNFSARYNVTSVGAPASAFYPEVCKRLKIALHLPDHAQVAGAIGSVMGSIVQRTRITITQPALNKYCLFGASKPEVFDSLDAARTRAEKLAYRLAEDQARKAGAQTMDTTISFEENHIRHDIDGDQFFDAVLTATTIGKPTLTPLVSNRVVAGTV